MLRKWKRGYIKGSGEEFTYISQAEASIYSQWSSLLCSSSSCVPPKFLRWISISSFCKGRLIVNATWFLFMSYISECWVKWWRFLQIESNRFQCKEKSEVPPWQVKLASSLRVSDLWFKFHSSFLWPLYNSIWYESMEVVPSIWCFCVKCILRFIPFRKRLMTASILVEFIFVFDSLLQCQTMCIRKNDKFYIILIIESIYITHLALNGRNVVKLKKYACGLFRLVISTR